MTAPTGELIDYGRSVYRPPADLARLVKARDRTCTFPHCTRPAMRCDLDHRHEWECGGKTCELNIDCLCQRHHHLRHNTTWTVQRLPGGTRRWTSPGGRVYTRPPATYPTDETRSTSTDQLFRRWNGPPEDDPPPF